MIDEMLSTSDEPDWSTLLAKARGGDCAALGQVWQHLRNYLLTVAGQGIRGNLRSKLDASDIVQQSLLEAQQSFGSFSGDSEEEMRAWLVKLVRHNLIDSARRFCETQHRDVSREVSLERSGRDADLVSEQASASSILSRRETDEELLRAINQLSRKRQRLLEMRHRQGLSYAEIGLRLNMTEISVRKMWSRTLHQLRDILAANHGYRPTQPR
jgi:RNA polymerase sigma-70 factor (ECF subfamily)